MKKLIVYLLISISMPGFAQQKAKTSGNPIFKGWYADPEGAVFGKEYWVYPTYSDKYENQVFMDAFSSKDLIKWEKHPSIIDTSAVKWAKKAMWAPAVVKNNDKYFLFFAANDIQSNKEMGGIGVAVASKPEGPFKDYLGKALVDKIVNGAQPIDQFVFKDMDGSWYMYYGGWRHCNIVKLKDDFTGIVPFDDGNLYKEVTPQGYVEGPFMFIRNGKYYFMWSEGSWTGPNYKVAYAMADNAFGPFNRIGEVLIQDFDIANGAGHHSIMHAPNSEDYYIVYHRRPNGETAGNHRETCIEKLSFDSDGKIIPVKVSYEGVEKNKIKSVRK